MASNFWELVYILLFICFWKSCHNITLPSVPEEITRVNKCCEKFEVLSEQLCVNANDTKSEIWKPVFTGYNHEQNVPIKHKFVIGDPACGSMQSWPIYQYDGSPDQLELLTDGKLRHYTEHNQSPVDDDDDLIDNLDSHDENKPFHHDYIQGLYCLDKAIGRSSDPHKEFLFAKVCLPTKIIKWTDSDFLFRKILNPFFHILSIIIFVLIAIVYFVLPTLRDLVGNIITTICISLAVSQAANLVRDFTQFKSHVSFFIADTFLYVSLSGAFFWLSCFGYYIWKTFRSRNVFLRITDGKKYCWYSLYAWSLTFLIATLAIFANYFLDNVSTYQTRNIMNEQETIGWLGIAIFFAPIAITMLIDLCFILTTFKLINRRNVYGRIQHKLKSNFIMYTLVCLVMTITWIFLILSWLNYDGLIYSHILVNALQGPLMFYICIFRQKHVIFLLKKTCCYNEPPSSNDWGDEMHYINCDDY